ncbi:DUF924 family protein [Pseudoalteromonas rubra]|uniref:DUF924 domain-containing protein n=1 Tax=Pseudoalteromonas rubra TaxID=43658 RepID=A0A0U2P3V7_9GAMM|nr:DUF924 family protein [Pseudoalteromonas rubra]ALU41741.1 hypothetical protein AT705_01645 [Pseudoalteromonas rubra]
MKVRPVINFWFDEIEEDKWWEKDEQFDALLREKFLELHYAAVRGELFEDRDNPFGRLQEIILLDQFSRNMFRGTPQAFKNDTQALVLSQEAVRANAQVDMAPDQKAFLYMPFMHSESLVIHDTAMKLFAEPGLEGYYDYEVKHREIIEKFGRYPHRNKALGRDSTEAELEFINSTSDF